jgi:hypothetical protein
MKLLAVHRLSTIFMPPNKEWPHSGNSSIQEKSKTVHIIKPTALDVYPISVGLKG